MKKLYLACAFLLLIPTLAHCGNSSGFSGASSGAAPASTPASPASPTTAASSSTASQSSATSASPTSAAADTAASTTAVAVAPPATAITKGSFTVWTNPTDPAPNVNYQVYVQVTLPSGLSNYTLADLTGQLVGTDGYTQGLASDAGFMDQQTFSYSGTTATLVITVPGGKRGVSDTISMHSTLLNDSETVSLTFGNQVATNP